MKYSGEVISAGIELYYAGVSLREISSLFWRLFGIRISRMGILKWAGKYSKHVKTFTEMKTYKGQKEGFCDCEGSVA